MSYLKVATILLASTLYCHSLETVHNVIDYDLKNHYCGELLLLAIETVCTKPQQNPFNDNQNPVDDISEKVTTRRKQYRLLLNQCCIKQCSMNFIKANCPGNPKIPTCKDGSPATTDTTPLPATTTTLPPTTITKTTTKTTKTQRYFELWSFFLPRPIMYTPLSPLFQ